ncbi:HNH endonuclease [Actinokineospora bangkokensis]|uniref:Endonuclease n=1 Tax=Actinokineospora bangkokensis TaxID=1193682 RepID=A0A1Q9LSI6_9PSEU|nr:HNH endonuclease [Actinokineospora bangkokensis]OLR94961.1 endonuclease [Actinokineospora bangkokensis]
MTHPPQPGRRERLQAILLRDGPTCAWCRTDLSGRTPATTDHVIPRVKGGPSWSENEVAACRRCNRLRGHTSPTDWLAECERLGWHPDEPRITRVLESLADAITTRGGQRRARTYLDAQLRRLAKR